MATATEQTKTAVVSKSQEGADSGSQSRAAGIAKILAPALGAREGARILIYGRTRWGKTAFAVDLLDAMVASDIASTILVHDPKYPDRQQYEGEPVRSDSELAGALGSSRIVVFRPPMPASSVAANARLLVEGGEPTAILIDETRRALGGFQKWGDADGEDGPNKGPKNFEWLLLEGGGLRASVVLLVQRPKQLPGDASDSAQCHVVFGLGGGSLRYLTKAGIVPDEARETVKQLTPGQFVVFSDDDEWDGIVYYSPLSG
jgi:hypothetical protein